jgi:hypothetical protein
MSGKFWITTVAFILLASSAALAQNRLSDISWLAGCWSGKMGAALYEECWTSSSAGLMQGSGRMTEGGRILMREHMTIESDGPKVMLYVLNYGAKLAADQPVVGFALVEQKSDRLVFENPQHDYPQRISYIRLKDGNAVARIETIDGKRAVDFPLNRQTGEKKP